MVLVPAERVQGEGGALQCGQDRGLDLRAHPDPSTGDPLERHRMTEIDALWPVPGTALTDQQLLRSYEPPAGPWLRMNFISSLDGAVTRDGLSGGLGDDADHRVFELLRRWADVVLLGAGTARDEGYGAMVLPEESARWRRERSLAPQPVFALVTKRLELDPDAPIFADAPVRPLVFTVEDAPARPRAALAEVADVIAVGEREVDPVRVRQELRRRDLVRIHSEGGPTLFGAFLAAGVVDELCLTLAPTLEAGPAQRIAHAMPAAPTAMELAGVLRAGDELLLRYTRAGARG